MMNKAMFLKVLLCAVVGILVISFVIIIEPFVYQWRTDVSFERVQQSIQENYREHKIEMEELVSFAESLPYSSTIESIGNKEFLFFFHLETLEMFPLETQAKFKSPTKISEDQFQKLQALLQQVNCEALLIEKNGDIRLIYDGILMVFHFEYLFTKNEIQVIEDSLKVVDEIHYPLDSGVYYRLYDSQLFCEAWIFTK